MLLTVIEGEGAMTVLTPPSLPPVPSRAGQIGLNVTLKAKPLGPMTATVLAARRFLIMVTTQKPFGKCFFSKDIQITKINKATSSEKSTSALF